MRKIKEKKSYNGPSIEERKFRISTGTWMGRRTVFNSGKQYDRKRTKQETRREEVES